MLSWIAQVLVLRPRARGVEIPGRRRALAGLGGLLDPRQGSDLADASDPGPQRAQAARVLGRLGRKALRRLRGARPTRPRPTRADPAVPRAVQRLSLPPYRLD
jgi:hypothetical protein